MKTKNLLIGAITLSFSILAAQAQLVVDFNTYTTGDLTGQAGSTGLTGNWTGVATNDIVAGNLAGPAGSASLIAPQTGTAQRVQVGTGSAFNSSQTYISLASSISETYWVSFLLQGSGSGDRIGMVFNPTGNGLDNAAYTIWKVANNISVRGSGEVSFDASALGNDFFLVSRVTRVSATTLTFDTWVNPTSLASFDSAAQITRTNISGGTISGTLSGIGVIGYGTGNSVDNIRIGSTLDAVVVPEPSTAALLAGGLLAMLAVCRRRLSIR